MRTRLARGGRLADDAHEPVLQISKKQNRELLYASVSEGKPETSRQNWQMTESR